MTHLFSEEEWTDYIEGRIDDESRDRIGRTSSASELLGV